MRRLLDREALARGRLLSRGLAGAYCLAFALIHALFFHNQFFDINRCKYYLFVISAYSAAALAGLAACLERVWLPEGAPSERLRPVYPALGMALMCLAAIVSTAITDEPLLSITGEKGRYAGLLFIGATGALYAFALWTRLEARRVLVALCVSLTLCSLLGVVNFLGWDPLGFYANLAEKYRTDFISTIGNINFFSACVCLLSALSAGYFVRARGWRSGAWLAAYLLSVMALLASRSDSALIALGGLFLAMLLFRLRGKGEVCRAFVLFGATAAAAFFTYWLCRARVGRFMDFKDSMAGYIIKEYELTGFLAVGLWLAAAVISIPEKPERALDAVQRVLGALALAAVGAGIGAIVYFTYIRPEAELPGFLSLMRFSDTWGTFRGFIWSRTWRMYWDLPILQKLFGAGPETLMKHIVANYNAEMVNLTGITFDNAHNEFLQYLFTIGAAGLAGYLGLIAGCYGRLLRRARADASAYAILLALSAYLLQSAFNIAQPETTPLLFLLLALGSRAERPTPAPKGGAPDEGLS